MVLGFAGQRKGALIRAAQHRDNGSLGQHGVEAHLFKAVDVLMRILIELLDTPGLIQDDLEGFVCRRRLRRWERR